MKKAIVTTTINAPTKALNKFLKIAFTQDWHLFIVGDKKTPKDAYSKFVAPDQVTYLDCDDQEAISKELSDLIGWNCIQRRNFGLIAAYNWGAEVIAVVDDDNIPNDDWGQNVELNKPVEANIFSVDTPVFDPIYQLSPQLWHRGFPIQLLPSRKISLPHYETRMPLVQADLWDGAPDVDAVCRITLNPQVQFARDIPKFGGNVMGPFNSQNTFLHRDCFPDYFLFPHIGRMDDIFASYYLQKIHPNSVLYARASVFQDRNEHDLSVDLHAELIGYKHALDFVNWCNSDDPKFPEFMPKDSIKAFQIYKQCFIIKLNRSIPLWRNKNVQ